NLANGKPLSEGIAFLEQLPMTTNSAVLSEKLGDLYAQQGKPSSSIHAWQEALKLKPSHEQRIRILLNVGEKFTAEKQEKEAYQSYQELLRDAPDYPDKMSVLQKLAVLARKLDHAAE